jgi:hypothetical protein
MSKKGTRSFLGIVLLDCRAMSEDETQQSAAETSPAHDKRTRTWMRWASFGSRRAKPGSEQAATGHARPSVSTLQALPSLLDCSSLPNGVVELVIDDFEDPSRQLFDINDGQVTLVAPGQCVPWASISGPPHAWVRALGPEHDTTALQLTGDEQLARRVLAALPQPD